MIAMRWSMKFMGLVSMAIVARLLVPADFGIFAIASTFIGLIGALTEIGSDLALIRHPDPKPKHYDTVWTFNVLIHALSALLIAISSTLAVHVYKDPRYQSLLYVMALSMLVSGFNNVGIVDFRRNMQFNRDFQYNVAVQLAGVVTTIISAYLFRSYWALLLGSLVRSLTGVALSYVMHPMRPRFSLSARQEMFGFSFWNMFRSLALFSASRGDRLILAAYFGATTIGFFSITGELAGMAVYELLHPIGRALLPSLTAMRRENGWDARNVKKIFNGAATLAMGAGVGLSAIADPAITLVYGQKFAAAGPMLAIMALIAAVSGFSQPTGQFLIALGKAKEFGLLYAFQAVLMLAMTWALSAGGFGIFAIVWAKFCVETIALLRLFYLLRYIDNVNWKDMLASWVRPILASAFMYGVIMALMKFLSVSAPGTQLAVAIPAGALAYSFALFTLWHLMHKPPGIEEEILQRFGWKASA